MTQTLKLFAVALLSFAVADGLWLGVVMARFYRTELGPIARMNNGALAPIWPIAALVYVLLAVGVVAFVVPRGQTPAASAAWGGLFGVVTYGVYDLTNHATLSGWPPAVTVVDMCWGAVATALASSVTAFVARI